jgi:hypothetical protein
MNENAFSISAMAVCIQSTVIVVQQSAIRSAWLPRHHAIGEIDLQRLPIRPLAVLGIWCRSLSANKKKQD